MPSTGLQLERIAAAYRQARGDLLAERTATGHWVGELSTSALSTATAVSALSLVRRHATSAGGANGATRDFTRVIAGGVEWLAGQQNDDGGWGDTDRSYSNISTTMLVRAAYHLAGVAEAQADALRNAEAYIARSGGVAGLRKRYGRDKTFAVPILTNCALAGLADWRDVSPLPFELACLPQSWYRFAQLPVVSYAIPALVAIGQARFHHRPPWNPLAWCVRRAAIEPSLRVLERMQPASGGYLEAVPLTSFVVMSLASIGRADHPVAQYGVQFILDSLRPDGSWPIDTNLATWNTTLAINALAAGGEDVAGLAPASAESPHELINWVLSCQYRERHPFTGADPGGWGWSDLSGAVPDADDTPGALLALAAWRDASSCSPEIRDQLTRAAALGLHWLLGLQNRDGGWPTFCRGWGKLPFDRSGADLTAHVLRAMQAWRDADLPGQVRGRCGRATERGFAYLTRAQRADGSWIPLWFGNQDHPQEENPTYGTAKVLLAYADAGRPAAPECRRGVEWLERSQRADGSWGSVEETSLAVETLAELVDLAPPPPSLVRALDWLCGNVETRRHLKPSPIGFYFARLWYYEQLYPLTFTVAALGRFLRRASEAGKSHLPARKHR